MNSKTLRQARQEIAYYQRLGEKYRRLEKRLEPKIYKGFRRIIRLITDPLLEQYRAEAEKLFLTAGVEAKATVLGSGPDVGLLPKILGEIDLTEGSFTYGGYQDDPANYDIQNPSYQAYWKQHWLKLCEETKADIEAATGKKFEQLYGRIKQEILDNEFSGNPVLYLTEELEKWFDDANKWKARRIAVTESNRISNAGFLADTQEDEVVLGYEYLLSADACDLCKAVGLGADGQPRQVAKGNAFAQKLDGDPYYATILAPPVHPNCRCTVVPVLDFEETRFGPSAKVEKGQVVDPGGMPLKRGPMVEIEDGETPEIKPEPKPKKPRKPRKPKEQAGVADTGVEDSQPNKPLSEDEAARAAILAAMREWRQKPQNQIDYDSSFADDLVASYTLAVGVKKRDAIAKLDDMEAYQKASGRQPILTDKEKSAIENKIAKKIKKDYPDLTDEDIRGMNAFTFLVNKEVKEQESGRRVSLMNEVRDRAFAILAVEAGDRLKMDITPKPHKSYNKKKQKLHDARMKAYLETIERIRPAVGKGTTDRSIGFDFVTDSTLTYDINNGYFSDDRDQVYVGVGDRVDESTVAHELGHAITIGRNKTPGGKRSQYYHAATSSGNIQRWDNWIEDTSGLHTDAYWDIASNGKAVLTEYSSDTGKNGESYAIERANYVKYQLQGRKHELPSVLLEMFYRDPVAFVKHMGPEVQGVLFGMLDGSLRE